MELAIGDGELVSMSDSTYGEAIKSLITSPYKEHNNIIWYGPYTILPPGSYTVIFRMKFLNITNIGERIITLEVTSNTGSKRLTFLNIFPEDIIEGQWMEIRLNLSLNSYEFYVEFRGVNAAKDAIIYLDYIKVIPTNLNKPVFIKSDIYTYDYRKIIPLQGSYVRENTSISYRVVKCEVLTSEPSILFYGPLEPLPAGTYILDLLIKIEGNIDPTTKFLSLIHI